MQERLPYVERGVAKKVVHPKYNFFTYEYDLALVRLESSLTFAPHISPICLPATDDLLIGENATVTGWGRLSEGGTLPSVLQEVNLMANFCCQYFLATFGVTKVTPLYHESPKTWGLLHGHFKSQKHPLRRGTSRTST